MFEEKGYIQSPSWRLTPGVYWCNEKIPWYGEENLSDCTCRCSLQSTLPSLSATLSPCRKGGKMEWTSSIKEPRFPTGKVGMQDSSLPEESEILEAWNPLVTHTPNVLHLRIVKNPFHYQRPSGKEEKKKSEASIRSLQTCLFNNWSQKISEAPGLCHIQISCQLPILVGQVSPWNNHQNWVLRSWMMQAPSCICYQLSSFIDKLFLTE